MTVRLSVTHPDLGQAFEVQAGRVRVLEGPDADVVVSVLIGASPDGQASVDGRRLPRSLAARVRRGLAVVAGTPVAPDVSVHDHLAGILGSQATNLLLAGTPLLAGRGGDPAGVLSGGERRVLAWLRARAVAPRAVLLDRAAEGMDAATLAWAGEVVDGWTTDGVAVAVRPGRVEERGWGRS